MPVDMFISQQRLHGISHVFNRNKVSMCWNVISSHFYDCILLKQHTHINVNIDRTGHSTTSVRVTVVQTKTFWKTLGNQEGLYN